MKKTALLAFAFMQVLCIAAIPGFGAQEVKIGVIYLMSGPAAQPGIDNKNVIDVALEIINTTNYKHLNLPLAKEAGLPNLGGAKVTVSFADHQRKPDLGLSEAERMITQEKGGRPFRCLPQQRDGNGQHGGKGIGRSSWDGQ